MTVGGKIFYETYFQSTPNNRLKYGQPSPQQSSNFVSVAESQRNRGKVVEASFAVGGSWVPVGDMC